MSSFTKKYLLLLAMMTGYLSAIEIQSATHAVDVAGKQRMFTQRMLKDYAMVGMGNSFANPTKDLKKTIDTFENHLDSLYAYTKNNQIKENITSIKKSWLTIKKTLLNKPNKNKVSQLEKDLEKLLQKSNNITELFAKDAGEVVGKTINISGRQRMLSQRMASLYMLKVWGVDDQNFKEKMSNSIKTFKDSLSQLKKSKLNTKEIEEHLHKVEKSFMFFEIMNRSSDVFIPTLIYKKSNDILKNMDSTTKLYVSINKKGGK